MQFKDLAINDVFCREGQNAQYIKVPEIRVSCCKVNATLRKDTEEEADRPLDQVVKINENKNLYLISKLTERSLYMQSSAISL